MQCAICRVLAPERHELAAYDLATKDSRRRDLVGGEWTTVGMVDISGSHDLLEVSPGAGTADHRRRGIAQDDSAVSINDRHGDGKLIENMCDAILVKPAASEAWALITPVTRLQFASPALGGPPNRSGTPANGLSHLVTEQ
jgi:hypothetical protein